MVETAVFSIDDHNALNGVRSAARFLCQSARTACKQGTHYRQEQSHKSMLRSSSFGLCLDYFDSFCVCVHSSSLPAVAFRANARPSHKSWLSLGRRLSTLANSTSAINLSCTQNHGKRT